MDRLTKKFPTQFSDCTSADSEADGAWKSGRRVNPMPFRIGQPAARRKEVLMAGRMRPGMNFPKGFDVHFGVRLAPSTLLVWK